MKFSTVSDVYSMGVVKFHRNSATMMLLILLHQMMLETLTGLVVFDDDREGNNLLCNQ